MRGGLVGLVAVGLLVVMAGGWLLWGRTAWNRRELRQRMSDALREYRQGRFDEGEALAAKARDFAERKGLSMSAEKELHDARRAILIRQAYEEQLKRERPMLTLGGRWARFRNLHSEALRCDLPCPPFIQFLAALED